MNQSKAYRRSQRHQEPFIPSEIVRVGLRIQRDIGTVTAMAYLASNGFGSTLIQRVLSREAIRSEDRSAAETR